MLAASAGDRRARQYHFDAANLLATVDPSTRSASGTSASGGADPPRPAYSAALNRWRQDIRAAASPDAAAMDTDLILFSMRAGTYLANTRTAAYLWVTANPAEAQRLLAEEDYLVDHLIPNDVSTAAAWTAELADQLAAAQSSVGASQELLTAPAVDGCASPAAAVASRLAAHLRALVVQDTERAPLGARRQ